jgi:hypothetical protein
MLRENVLIKNEARLSSGIQTCVRVLAEVHEDILGVTQKHLTGHVKLKQKIVINTE